VEMNRQRMQTKNGNLHSNSKSKAEALQVAPITGTFHFFFDHFYVFPTKAATQSHHPKITT